ncbi:hypothetical protein V6O07_17650, partial [Arthrospira platensis SPKY2]
GRDVRHELLGKHPCLQVVVSRPFGSREAANPGGPGLCGRQFRFDIPPFAEAFCDERRSRAQELYLSFFPNSSGIRVESGAMWRARLSNPIKKRHVKVD